MFELRKLHGLTGELCRIIRHLRRDGPRSGRSRRMKTITGTACKRESLRARGESFSNQPVRGLKPLRGQPRLFSLNHNNETDLMFAVETKLHASACSYQMRVDCSAVLIYKADPL